MSGETETFKLEDGSVVGTGLLVPNEQEQLLMANVAEYSSEMFWDDDRIKAQRLAPGCAQRYLQERKRRLKRMRNQGNLGKCNGSSNTSAVENLREDQGMPDVALSDCYAYSLANGGRDVGSGLITTLKTSQTHGFSPMELQVGGITKVLPNTFYNRNQLEPDVLKQADIEAKRFVGFEYFKAPIDKYENFIRALATAVARGHQIVFAWHVGANSSRLNNGYVQVGRGNGNHSNLIHSAKWVGGKDIVHFDDMNSWGPSQNALYGRVGGQGWGEQGFGLFRPEDVYACAHVHCCYICTSAIVDPNDPAFQ